MPNEGTGQNNMVTALNQCIMDQGFVGRQIRLICLKNLARSHRHRLALLGLRKNALLTVKYITPLGDPICVEVQGSLVALRKQDCQGILVEIS